MNKYITRKIARVEACKFTTDDVRRLNNRPEMCGYTCLEWLDGFTTWIESAYDNKATSYEEMAAIFNKNTSSYIKEEYFNDYIKRSTCFDSN